MCLHWTVPYKEGEDIIKELIGKDTMADMNIPADDVPVSKSNYVLDILKPQKSPIFKVALAILKNTNFFKAFTASSTIPAIYIQQFWDTMRYDSTTRIYNCQLDEKWFNLYKDILRDALQITPINDNDPFMAPPSSDTVIEYVNTLEYPCTLKNVSAMFVNSLYQPWRAILSIINMRLTSKTANHDLPRHLVMQILWGVIHCSNIDYAERIWKEFVQSIQTFLTDKKSLTTATRGKKKSTPLLILSIRFTKLIIHYLKTKHNIHPRPDSPLYYSHEDHVLALSADQPSAPKATKVTKPTGDEAPKHSSSQPPKSTPAPTESSKKDQGKKRKLVKETSDAPSPAKQSKAGKVTKKRMPKSYLRLVDEFVDEGVPHKEPAYDDEEANLQRALELSLKDQGERTQGPARPVVFREPDSGRFQPLPEVQGKGKEKVIEEQAAHDLLTLQTPKR
ncbi:monodehydroascorbate reductase [Tanacetum coccineum]